MLGGSGGPLEKRQRTNDAENITTADVSTAGVSSGVDQGLLQQALQQTELLQAQLKQAQLQQAQLQQAQQMQAYMQQMLMNHSIGSQGVLNMQSMFNPGAGIGLSAPLTAASLQTSGPGSSQVSQEPSVISESLSSSPAATLDQQSMLTPCSGTGLPAPLTSASLQTSGHGNSQLSQKPVVTSQSLTPSPAGILGQQSMFNPCSGIGLSAPLTLATLQTSRHGNSQLSQKLAVTSHSFSPSPVSILDQCTEEGRVAKWNDEKGFGFITPSLGGPDIFVMRHVIFAGQPHKNTGRLLPGEQVLYSPPVPNPKGKDGSVTVNQVYGPGVDIGPAPDQLTGTVSRWEDQKGFGWIAPSDGGKDVFVMRRAIGVTRGAGLIRGGMIHYSPPVPNPKGKPGDMITERVQGPATNVIPPKQAVTPATGLHAIADVPTTATKATGDSPAMASQSVFSEEPLNVTAASLNCEQFIASESMHVDQVLDASSTAAAPESWSGDGDLDASAAGQVSNLDGMWQSPEELVHFSGSIIEPDCGDAVQLIDEDQNQIAFA